MITAVIRQRTRDPAVTRKYQLLREDVPGFQLLQDYCSWWIGSWLDLDWTLLEITWLWFKSPLTGTGWLLTGSLRLLVSFPPALALGLTFLHLLGTNAGIILPALGEGKVLRVFSSGRTLPRNQGWLNFWETRLVTVRKSSHRSCWTELTCQGILLP